MGFAGKRMALEFRDNVRKNDDEMFFCVDAGGPANRRSLIDQRDEALRASRADRLGQLRKRAHMDARNPINPPETGQKSRRL